MRWDGWKDIDESLGGFIPLPLTCAGHNVRSGKKKKASFAFSSLLEDYYPMVVDALLFSGNCFRVEWRLY